PADRARRRGGGLARGRGRGPRRQRSSQPGGRRGHREQHKPPGPHQVRDKGEGPKRARRFPRSVMTSTLPDPRSRPIAVTPLDDYLALCKDACDGEIERLYGPDERGSNGLYDLILDYPLRGGKALRPALSIATCLGLGGHLEAVLPTAATLELYHNAF